MLASRDGTIWAGGPAGLSSIRGRTVTSIQPSRTGKRATQVTSLLEDHAGRIWVGLENSLYVYDRGIFHSVMRPDGRQPGFVVGLAEDSDHNIWAEIIGPPRALLRISNLVVDREVREPEMPAARKLAIAPDGSLWLGLLTGDLARYKEGKTDIFRFKNNPTPTLDSLVNEVVVATDGSVLGVTSFGLIAWKNGTQQTMTTKNGLPCDAIYSAVTDRRGTLWLYTQCGIVEVASAELQKWWKDSNARLQVRTIGPLDGAQPGWVPFQGAAASPNGRVWFANFTALQVFDTSDASRNSMPPPVYIQDVVADPAGQRIFAKSAIEHVEAIAALMNSRPASRISLEDRISIEASEAFGDRACEVIVNFVGAGDPRLVNRMGEEILPLTVSS